MADDNPEELAKLLDDALNDFKPPQKSSGDDDLDEYMQKMDQEAAQKAAESFQAMLQNMAVSIKSEGEASSSKVADEASIARSISNLIFSSNGEANDQEITKELEKLSLTKGSLDDLMETIVKTAVSKEAMYPAIRLHDKFGPFIEEKKDELDADTLHCYQEQCRILGLLRVVYEDEGNGSDQEKAKVERASRIAQLWLEMQKHGMPPPELASSLNFGDLPDDQTDEDNLNGCSVM